jgi:hypothetical protein
MSNFLGIVQVQDVFKDRIKAVKTVALIPTVLNQSTRVEVYVMDPLIEQQKKLLKTT